MFDSTVALKPAVVCKITVETGNYSSYCDSEARVIKDQVLEYRLDTQTINRLKPSIHPAYARLLCAHMRTMGITMDALFQGSTMTWQDLLKRQVFISYEQFRLLSENAIRLSACPWLGLELSSIMQASAHGPLGYGALAARDVRQGFRLIEKMLPTRISIYTFQVIEQAPHAYFELDENIEKGELQEFVDVMLLGSFFDMLEKMSSEAISGVQVAFPFPEPEWSERYYARFTGASIAFSSDKFRITLPLALFDQPCMTADEFAYRNAERECAALLDNESQGGDLARRLKQELLEQEGAYPTLEQKAEQHCMSSRTLIRKLKQENTHYQAIVDEVRKELACWRLQNTPLSIERIAEALGFQDTSNFSRVFRRWCDCTPSEFRANGGLYRDKASGR